MMIYWIDSFHFLGQRVIAYMLKFIQKLKENFSRVTYYSDLQNAKICLISYTQTCHFSCEKSKREAHFSHWTHFRTQRNCSVLLKDWQTLVWFQWKASHNYLRKIPPFTTMFLVFLHQLTMHDQNRLMQQIVRQAFYIPHKIPRFSCVNLALCQTENAYVDHGRSSTWTLKFCFTIY